ncbi:hypothetical protein ACRRTK_010796 [Alexandromys fortis]
MPIRQVDGTSRQAVSPHIHPTFINTDNLAVNAATVHLYVDDEKQFANSPLSARSVSGNECNALVPSSHSTYTAPPGFPEGEGTKDKRTHAKLRSLRYRAQVWLIRNDALKAYGLRYRAQVWLIRNDALKAYGLRALKSHISEAVFEIKLASQNPLPKQFHNAVMLLALLEFKKDDFCILLGLGFWLYSSGSHVTLEEGWDTSVGHILRTAGTDPDLKSKNTDLYECPMLLGLNVEPCMDTGNAEALAEHAAAAQLLLALNRAEKLKWKPFFIPFNSVSFSKVQYGVTAAPSWGNSSFPTLSLIVQTNPAQGFSAFAVPFLAAAGVPERH